MTRIAKCFLIGVAALSILTTSFLSRPGAEEKPTQPAAAVVGPIYVCPKYPYMNHGTYTSYYATVHDNGTNSCASPISYDSSTSPSLNGDCSDNNPLCIGPFELDFDRAKNASLLISHDADRRLKDVGIDPDVVPTNVPSAGAVVQDLRVNIIEFTKNPNGGRRMKAQVARVQLTPQNFQPPLSGPSLEVGVGQSIVTGRPDRSFEDHDVVTLHREKHLVYVRVKITRNDWREYQIVLRNGEGGDGE